MKKRLLVSLLCMVMCTSMLTEAGAAAFTEPSAEVFGDSSMFTDTMTEADTVTETSQPEVNTVVENVTGEQIPVVEDVPTVEEVPGTEEVPSVEEVPGTEEVPSVEEVPGTEEVPSVEEVPGVEEVPSVEEVPGTEEVPSVEELPGIEEVPSEEEVPGTEDIPSEDEVFVDIFTSGINETEEEMFVSVEVDTTDLVNQEGIVYSVTDWKLDEKGWKLVKELIQDEEEKVPDTDGTVKDEQYIGTVSYFTLTDGIVRVITKQDESTVVSDGYYLFNADGYLVTGQYTMAPGTPGYIYEAANEYLYMDAAHATLNSGIAEGTEKTPYNSNLGQLQRNYWFWTGTAFRYYDNSGKFNSVQELKAAALANNTYVGYYQINGKNYALKEDGTPLTGIQKIKEGNKQGEYYFSKKADTSSIPGQMITGQWVEVVSNVRWRYYGDDGLRTNYTRMVSDLAGKAGNYDYLLNENGTLIKKKPLKINGVYYFGDSKGRIVKDKMVKYKNRRFYYSADGSLANYKNGWYRCASQKNRYYYFGKTAGRVVEKKGWHRINGDWYYFSSNGNHYINKWTSKGRYFRADGSMCSGLCEVNGKMYFFKVSTAKKAHGGAYKNKSFKSGNQYYYATSDRSLLKTGWVKLNSNYYYYYDYKRQCNSFAKLNGVNGYLDSNGKYTTGWITINDAQNLVKYVNPTGNDFYKNTTAWINGLQYRFDSNGYRVNDRTDEFSGPYYVEADIVNCVMTIYTSDKKIPVKSIRISPGAAGTETPTGTYRLNRLGRWWTLMGPSYGQYCTHVVGAGQGGIIVHSVPANSMSIWSFSPSAYKLLGKPASHGCIRCCVADTKWVYDKCQGATIRIFKGAYTYKEVFRGPLGRRPIIPATGNYDPTDPAIVGNKYYNKY